MRFSVFSFLIFACLCACKQSSPSPSTQSNSNNSATNAGSSSSSLYESVHVSEPGTIRGRVIWDGPRPNNPVIPVPDTPGTRQSCGNEQRIPVLQLGPNNGVQYTVLSLLEIRRGKPIVLWDPLMDQQRCQWSSHVVAVSVGERLRLVNSDEVLHTVHGFQGYRSAINAFNRATPHGATVSVTMQTPGITTLVCDAGHTWMLGFVHTFPHPYHVVTNASGEYILDGIPPGTHRLHVWHEGVTVGGNDASQRPTFGPEIQTTMEITVPPSGMVELDFVLTATGITPRPGDSSAVASILAVE